MAEDRADRQRRLPGWDQERLSDAVVVIAGVGALGNSVAQTLALAGVGRMLLVDPDVVELSNLARAPLFRAADLGRPKALVAARALEALTPGLRAEARVGRVEAAVGLGELARADLVLGCLDSRAARIALADRRGAVGAPLLDGATGLWAGEVRPTLEPDAPCYGCTLSPEDRGSTDAPWTCGDLSAADPAAAAAPLSALVGDVLALLAVQHLMGSPVPPELRVLDARAGELRRVAWSRSPSCPFHHRLPPARPSALDARATVAELLAELGADERALAPRPIQRQRRCRSCGYREERWGLPQSGTCPRCGGALRPLSTEALDQAPPELALCDLGVPPGEILVLRHPDGPRALALAGGWAG